MEDDEYEELPPGTSHTTHLIAGALAGIAEHLVAYPLDAVKVKEKMFLFNV